MNQRLPIRETAAHRGRAILRNPVPLPVPSPSPASKAISKPEPSPRRGQTLGLGLVLLLASAGPITGRCAEPSGVPAPSLVPVELRTEYRGDPTGVETPAPRLSWELTPAQDGLRGLRQTAFRILVASAADRLEPGRADLWDSGEVSGPATFLVEYAGRPLPPLQACHWRVRARDQEGVWSDWSAPARWTMGRMGVWSPAARWIGTGESFRRGAGSPPPDNAPPDPWFRKVIVLDAPPARVTACVASVGFHELWVNGRKVGDAVLSPGATDNSKRARYLQYEIADRLRPGTNVIGLWLGTGWSIYPKFATADKPRAPIVLGQFDFVDARGTNWSLVTDGSWRTHPSPNRLLGVWDFMHFGGERYDAGLERPDWCEASHDDSGWRSAVEYRPNLVVSADPAEPNRERLLGWRSARSIQEVEPGVWRIDMGGNFAGTFRARVEGRPGDVLEFQFSEQPGRAMTHRIRSGYVVGASGEGEFRNRFNYSVGRWVTLRGLRRKPSLTAFEGRVVRTDYTAASRFGCTDPVLSQIYRTTLETFENLTLGGYVVDCPQRERMGYGGDAHATTTTGLANYHLGAFYTKWAEDWRDAQGRGSSWGPETEGGAAAGEPGNLPYTAPTYWGGGGPAWSGFVVHLAHEMWRSYGDRRICRDMLPTIRGWLEFLETRQQDNLLRRWGGEWDFLGDWLWPGAKGVNGDTPETLFFNNAYWVYNLRTAAEIASVVGESALAERWRARADEVGRAVHARFYDPARHTYANGGQAYLAIALVAGVPPPGLREGVWRQLEDEILVRRQGHIHAGITGGAFLFKLLMESRRNDLIYTMVRQEGYPGWADMLKQGATTFWESWENNPDLSYLHSSYLYVGAWFIHGILGIQPIEPGYSRFRVHPGPVDQPELGQAAGTFHSPHGPIDVQWLRSGRRFHLEVTVPPNTTAEIDVPARAADAIEPVPGTRILGFDNGRVRLEVGSGRYAFSSERE